VLLLLLLVLVVDLWLVGTVNNISVPRSRSVATPPQLLYLSLPR